MARQMRAAYENGGLREGSHRKSAEDSSSLNKRTDRIADCNFGFVTAVARLFLERPDFDPEGP